MSSAGGNYSLCDDWTTMEEEGMSTKAETPGDAFDRLDCTIMQMMFLYPQNILLFPFVK